MGELLVYGVSAVALIIVIVNYAKDSLGLDHRWAPPLSVALGLAFAVFAHLATGSPATWPETAFQGFVTGLVASGLYSGQKAVRGL